MKKFYLLFMFPLFGFCQSAFVLPKDVESKGFTSAVGEYIKAMQTTYKTSFDTLFIGKQEEMADVKLPGIIENTKIMVLTTDDAEKKFKYKDTFYFVNMIGDFSKDICFFKLITFKTEKTPEKNYWWPLHNCDVVFNYNIKTKIFTRNKLGFEYSYSNKYADKK